MEQALEMYEERLKEKRKIRRQEKQKRYYTKRGEIVRENLRKLRDEFENENPQVRNKKRRSAQASKKKDNGKRTRGETLFNSSGMILYLCTACKTSNPKINYEKETHCKVCETKFRFQCAMCLLSYTSHTGCNEHIKYKHLDDNFFEIGAEFCTSVLEDNCVDYFVKVCSIKKEKPLKSETSDTFKVSSFQVKYEDFVKKLKASNGFEQKNWQKQGKLEPERDTQSTYYFKCMSSDDDDCKIKTDEKALLSSYMYYCQECHNSYNKYRGYSISNCPNCKKRLIYRCVKCISLRQTERSIKRHVFYCRQGPINKREKDSESESESSDSSSDSAPQTMNRNRTKLKFSTKNLVILFCPSCKKSTPKIHGVKTNECQDCQEALIYVCKKCNNRYKSHNALTTHLKYSCDRFSE